jgi:chromosome segregation ATPase
LTEENASISKVNQLLNKSNFNLQNQVNAMESFNHRSNQVMDNLVNYVVFLKNELSSSQAASKELDNHYNYLQNKSKDIFNKNTELRNELMKKKEMNEELIRENNELKSQYMQILLKYKGEYQQIQSQSREIVENFKEQERKNKELENINNMLKKDLITGENIIENLKKAISILSAEKENEKYKNDLDELSHFVDLKDKEIYKKDEMIRKMIELNNAVKLENEEKISQSKKLKGELKQKKAISSKAKDIKEEIVNYNNKIEGLNEIIKERDKTLNMLKGSKQNVSDMLFIS